MSATSGSDSYTGACLCGAAGWHITGGLRDVTICNCSACRRSGAVWSYGSFGPQLTLTGETTLFRRDGFDLSWGRCARCGDLTHWIAQRKDGPIGAVNLRLCTEPERLHDVPLKHFEGAVTFEDVEPDSPTLARHIRDLWI